MANSYDVAVVGTGVVGLAAAHELLTRGLSVGIVGPRDDPSKGGASWAAGAMLSTFSEVEPHQHPDRVAVETGQRLAAHTRYDRWLERLRADSGMALTAPAGTWVVVPGAPTKSLDVIADAARDAGHPAEEHPASSVPGLRGPAARGSALWLPTERYVDSAVLMTALTAAISANPHATWITHPARAVRPHHIDINDGAPVAAGQVILAAGTAIPHLLGEAAADLEIPPILAGRGVSLLIRTGDPAPPHVIRTPNAGFACGTHLVPRSNGLVYLGGTNRLTLGADPDHAPTLDELSTLITDAAAGIDDRLLTAELVGPRMGLRPYTLDHQPLIGPTTEPSLLLATATYRCGVLLAPHLAALLADEITRPGALADHPYRAQRPLSPPTIRQVLDDGAARDLLDHLMRGASLPAGAADGLAAFVDVALGRLLTGDPAPGALRRLWTTAPVPEAVPSLFSLAQRLKAAR